MKKDNIKEKKLIRTFIAFDIDESLRQQLIAVIEFLKQKNSDRIKWISPENLHVTLRFLGEIEENKIMEIQHELAEKIKTIQSFAIKTGKIMTFPPGSTRPHIVALMFPLTQELAFLVQAIEQTVNQCGFEPENRPFLPHLTIARISGRIEPDLDNILIELSEKIAIKSVIIYRSDQKENGSVYTSMKEIKLT